MRTAVPGLALAAATGWVLDRSGLVANPLAGVEEAAVTHPWWVVAGLAVVAAACRLADHRPTPATGERGQAVLVR